MILSLMMDLFVLGVITVLTLVISVLISIVSDRLGTIQDNGQSFEAFVGVILLDIRQDALLQEVRPDNEEGQIGPLFDDIGIGDNLNRRTIDEDIIILFSQSLDQLA